MKNKFLTITFLVVIFGVFLFVPAKEMLIRLHKVNFYKSDNWKTVPKTNDKIYDKIMSLESFIENRYENYFPFYNKINSVYYNSIINIDSLYLDDIYLKENTDQDRVFYDKDNNFYYLVNKYSKDELNNRMNTEVGFYNSLASKYSNINFAIYLPLRYEMTSAKNVNGYHDMVVEFEEKLDDNIQVTDLDSKTTEEYLKYFYKTDHHFNSYGAYISYNDILDMYGISSNLEFKIKEVINPYYGSMAKSLLSTKVSDTLIALDYPNNLKVKVDGEDFKPLEVDKKANPFYDYYVKYFNGQYDEVIYQSELHTGNNLLIISDSFAWQIDYLLASHFDNTYVINMRYGKWKNNNLDFDKYIKENNITHVLVLMETKNIIFDIDNFKINERVVY
mgnify:CR=1 FL=1